MKFDKNTIIGFTLIAIIFAGFMWLSKPTEEQKKAAEEKQIALAQQQAEQQAIAALAADSVATTNNAVAQENAINENFGYFAVATTNEESFYTLENDLLKINISNKGGRIYSAELKNYKTYDSLPLILFDAEESAMAFTLATNNNRVVSTANLFFEPLTAVQTDTDGSQTLTLRLKTAKPNSFLDIVYTLPKDDYMLRFTLKANKMDSLLLAGTNFLEMQWAAKIRQQEKGRTFEDRYSQVMYKFSGDDVEKLSETKDESKLESSKIKWIAYKDQFFSSVLIADEWFSDTKMNSLKEGEYSGYLKSYASSMTVPFDLTGKTPTGFRMYLGPNQYKILNAYDKGKNDNEKLYLRNLLSLGWSFLSWINRFAIIPIFNVLSEFISNFGIIILILTLIVKTVLFPLTYKSYMSSAKMRVLKPEIDALNAKIPADKPQERQQATMKLYSKMGVSPMSGCLPMVIQFPVLVALFYFFPAAIELRGESFLWAKDLSSYDSIFSLPFSIPFYGSHISLFALLMAVATIISTKLNPQSQPMGDQPGMGMMKWMMYLMPVMFLFIFNGYASGLTYYYFLSTLISIIQMYVIRAFVDEKAVLAQLHAKASAKNAAADKGGKKKMSFMERLEKMQREQQKTMREQAKNKKR